MQSIEELQKLTKEELLYLWRKLPGRQPPPARTDRLLRELAYRMQEAELGRLDKNTTVSLRRHMTEFEKSLQNQKTAAPELKAAPKITLETGSVLTRDWEGKRITVQVTGPRQFACEGETYKSLSALARKITGQHLSGPLFFGLKENHHG
ncbi:Protein of unknown function (DUF2924) [Prosthecobacter fusiformis]|uniref:DUF2924 domain-containing protein n=1 Tax=Prosthecobacter fusiformis TaxID=48464 RepID=A0A4R7S1M9_9BACT|nr:DUF2924 domain-containing protein [Prosthecobacter fusiformis]TDU71115.1 Protein of unknown function (DUF2924) [Prosthecobacter fusiformis]